MKSNGSSGTTSPVVGSPKTERWKFFKTLQRKIKASARASDVTVDPKLMSMDRISGNKQIRGSQSSKLSFATIVSLKKSDIRKWQSAEALKPKVVAPSHLSDDIIVKSSVSSSKDIYHSEKCSEHNIPLSNEISYVGPIVDILQSQSPQVTQSAVSPAGDSNVPSLVTSPDPLSPSTTTSATLVR
jgi:hypothetical protein